MRGLLETAVHAVVVVGELGRIVLVNPAAERLFGYRREELVGEQVEVLVPEGFRNSHAHQRERFNASGGVRPMGIGLELYARRKDGSEVPVEIGLSRLRSDQGDTLISATISDITLRKRAEARVAHLAAVVESSGDATIGMTLDGRITSWNPAAERTYGYSAEEAIGQSIQMLCSTEREWTEASEILERVARGETVDHFETVRRCKDGTLIDVSVTVSPLSDARGEIVGASTTARDITDRKRYEKRLQDLADHDPLTGLLNRRSLTRELESHVARVNRYGAEGALLILDLDHFKYVNDTLGHRAGDEIIVRTAEALRARLRQSDVLARLGGDEFAVLLPRGDAHTAQRVAAELQAALAEDPSSPTAVAPRLITASIGIATFEPQLTGEDLLVNADIAMYDAKEAGRNQHRLYDRARDPTGRMHGQVNSIQRIRNALDHERFALFSQPIVDYATGRPSQHELLLRMRDERNQLLLPATFLSIAERLELILDIDRWVTRRAIELLADNRGMGDGLPLHVNLSARSLGDPTLLDLIEAELARTDVAPHQLVFEITETAAITHITEARQFSDHLRTLGCRLALDDFGAGFGSFYYLKQLPFDYLKIDGEFVRNCTSNKTDRLVIQAVVDIARGLGKRTIAEFVTDAATVSLLTQLGVDCGQGYHHGMPGPITGAPSD